MRDGGLTLTLDFAPRPEARGVILHLPPLCEEVQVETGAAPCPRAHGGWVVPLDAREVRVRWRATALPDISSRRVVAAYLDDYQTRLPKREGSERAARKADSTP